MRYLGPEALLALCCSQVARKLGHILQDVRAGGVEQVVAALSEREREGQRDVDSGRTEWVSGLFRISITI